MNNCLVLNKFYQPVRIINVYLAIGKVYSGKAKIIDSEGRFYTWGEWVEFSKSDNIGYEIVHSVNLNFFKPVVIMVYGNYYNKPTIPRPTRRNICIRDENSCQYCGSKKQLTIDHVVPKCKGGKTEWTNVVMACHRCNNKKNSLLLEESGMKLSKKLISPTWGDLFKLTLKNELDLNSFLFK